MTRLMADTINTTVSDIQHLEGSQTIDMVAGYANGTYAWSASDWQRFPHQAHVTIDVRGTDPSADVLDVENGDATPADAVTWIKNKKLLKPAYPGVLYCNRSNITALFNALNAAGYNVVRDFRLWVATLDGTKSIPDMTGVTAIQYASASMTHTNVDLSLVFDGAWKQTPIVTPPPPPPVHVPVPTLDNETADYVAGKVWGSLYYLDHPGEPAGTDAGSVALRDGADKLRAQIGAYLAAQERADDALLVKRLNQLLDAMKLPHLPA